MSANNSLSSTVDKAKDFLSSFVDKVKLARGKKFTFLLVGRTGVGKSSPVNSLMGKSIAQVGHYEPTTMGVESYDSEINGIDFTVIDTPGLCDDLEEEGNDEKYLERMRSKVEQIDSMWFVSRLDETRVTADEKRGIKLISNAFSPKVWEHAVIIFTYANSLEEARYREALDKKTELIEKEIGKYTSAEVAESIPSVAVDNMSKTTPDGKEWLGELYTQVFIRISERGILPCLIATANRIKPLQSKANKQHFNNAKDSNWRFYADKSGNTQEAKEEQEDPRININDVQKDLIKEKIIDAGIIPALAGASIGGAFSPAGAALGGAVGAVVGLVAWIFA